MSCAGTETCFCCLFLRTSRKAIIAIAATAAAPIPAPIPAFAPVDRPLLLDAGADGTGVFDDGVPVFEVTGLVLIIVLLVVALVVVDVVTFGSVAL